MNPQPVIEYLLNVVGGTKSLYATTNSTVACWEPVSDNSTIATKKADGDLRFDRMLPRTSFQDRPIDLNGGVALRSALLKYAKNPSVNPLYVQTEYRHPAFAAQEEQFDRMIESVGSIPGCFARIPPNFNGNVSAFALRASDSILYLQSYFIKTMWFINEINIKNGIIQIPPELCAAAQLKGNVSVYTAHDTKTAMTASCYYAIAPDHILAWTLALPEFQRKRHGVYAEEIYIDHSLWCYLIPDWCLHSLYTSFYHNWLNRVDKIPLSELQSMINVVGSEPETMIRLSVSYLCAPMLSLEEINRLAPVMHPDFPLFTQSAAMKAHIYDEQERREQEKKKITE